MKNGQLVSSCPQCHNEIVLTAGDTNVNPVIASENFDDEKLDNFNVTIKDYNDGNGQMSYQSTIYLPKDVIINASNAGHPYTCNMYLYVNDINGSKEKVFIRNMSNNKVYKGKYISSLHKNKQNLNHLLLLDFHRYLF